MAENNKILLKVQGITYNPVQTGAYALLLREANGPYRIPVVVGVAEAQSIAMRLENIVPPRPMSHDLMVSIFHAYGISLDEVFIYKFSEGIFMSELHLHNGEQEIVLDSRTSDAIALALRTNAPIYTYPDIIATTGIMMQDDESSPVVHKQKRRLDELSVEELEERMQRYADQEEYELAAEIQKIIKKKQETPAGNATENKE